METRMPIELFHQMLQSEEEAAANSLLGLLRQLTQVADASPLGEPKPAPLGAWSGWGI